EGGYNVDGADSFYARMAEQDAEAPRMGESGGRLGFRGTSRASLSPSAPAPPRTSASCSLMSSSPWKPPRRKPLPQMLSAPAAAAPPAAAAIPPPAAAAAGMAIWSSHALASGQG
ncbi:unnamed protein product, partial [Closterium sp. Naga37s-1]